MRRRVVLGLLALATAWASFVWVTKPWVPTIETNPPGDTGRRVANADLFGNYFPAAGPAPGPALLLLGGSEGGLGNPRVAVDLQRNGFSVLQAAYFGVPGTPRQLERVPLETFDRALRWLRAQPEVDPQRVGVIGQSKGAEAALLVGTRDRQLRAVVASAPSSYVWPGIDFKSFRSESSWTAEGQDLPMLPYGPFHISTYLNQDAGRLYREGYPGRRHHRDAQIRVTEIAAPVLLICGEQDTLWPACAMARELKAQRRSVELLAYPGAGHRVFGPPTAPDDPSLRRWGGSPMGNNTARRDAWPKVIAFLATALAASETRVP